MGLFGKVKGFLNVDGLKVELHDLDVPLRPNYTLGGTVRLSSGTACTVLEAGCALIAQRTHDDGRVVDTVLSRTNSLFDSSQDGPPEPIAYPCDLGAGEQRDLRFHLINIDLDKAKQKLGYASLDEINQATDVRVFLKADADVKGSPFDPEADVNVELAN